MFDLVPTSLFMYFLNYTSVPYLLMLIPVMIFFTTILTDLRYICYQVTSRYKFYKTGLIITSVVLQPMTIFFWFSCNGQSYMGTGHFYHGQIITEQQVTNMRIMTEPLYLKDPLFETLTMAKWFVLILYVITTVVILLGVRTLVAEILKSELTNLNVDTDTRIRKALVILGIAVVILGIAMAIDFGLTMSGINASFFENLGYSRFPFR